MSKQNADAITTRLKVINDEIRQLLTDNIRQYESAILECHCEIPNNIYTHIYTVLADFINKKLSVNREEYYYLMKCGSIILTSFIKLDTMMPPVQNRTINKIIVALFFLNYIAKKLLPYAYKQKYMCDLDQYIIMYYSDMIPNYKDGLLQIYGNQKKILYVKKYPYNIDSKIFCTLIEYFVKMDYIIDEIPASYIVKDIVLTENELALFDVNQREVDYLFGYTACRADYSNTDSHDFNNSIEDDYEDFHSNQVVDDMESYEQINGQQANEDDDAEEEDYSYNDDYE